MARLLLAWERGAGTGHAVVLAQLARLLIERGHDVHLAWRDLAAGARLLGELLRSPRLHLWQAPLAAERADDPPDPASYPELLLRAGFRDREGLLVRVLAWRRLLAAVEPELLLVEHAPTALLAARGGATRLAQIGSSFVIPPVATPFPSFNDWLPIDPERLLAAERLALEHANRVLVATGRTPLDRLADLLQVDARFRLGFRELDHHAAQRGAAETPACGWPQAPDDGIDPVWPDDARPRLFGYLPRSHPALGSALARLHAAPVASLLHIAGATDAEAREAGSTRLTVVSQPVRAARALEQASVLLGHGGAGSTHEALQAGRPVLLLPMQAEQLLLARRVAAAGAGIFMWPQEVESGFDRALAALLDSPGFAAAARSLAARNRAPDGQPLLLTIAQRCEALAGAGAPPAAQ